MISRRVAGILLGYATDLAFADPRRGHPVAGFGSASAALERVTYRDSRIAGAVHVALLLIPLTAGAELLRRSAVALAAATWVSLGGTSLTRTGLAIADDLDRDDIIAARELLPSLCGRDPAHLDHAGLTRAALESIAENTSDAQVAPLVWAAVGGVPGVLVYRAVNTLDAMVGHRSPRYAQFGWAAARLDDIANSLGARVAGALVVACAPLVGGSAVGAWRAWRRDAAAHPS
ncbi:MAG TPA: CobD/CbiB family cobalamin biosynthesis protein, partial [Mycobacterium sp.]|nr:CobD/CbiB family cobalamin biosynthesis protein [Mycobacterium sp.]